MDDRINIHIVDDHPVIRESLSEYFNSKKLFHVTGSSANADDAMQSICKHPPDILILDIEIPGENAFEFARKVHSLGGKTKILFFSAFLSDAYILEASSLPVFGYLTKTVSLDELAQGVLALHQGKHVFSKDVQSRFPEGTASFLSKKPKVRLSTLTPREREVLKFIASDMTGKEIAMKLGLSSRTVDRHKANIMEKLAIHSQVGLTRFVVAEGLCETLWTRQTNDNAIS
jgi:DNA-binding NarL/FixJ family response regulator